MKNLVLCALTVVLAIAASPVVVQSAASAPMRVGVEVESLDLARGKQLDFLAVFRSACSETGTSLRADVQRHGGDAGNLRDRRTHLEGLALPRNCT